MTYQLGYIPATNINVSAQLIAFSPMASLPTGMLDPLEIRIASTKTPTNELFPYQIPPDQ